MPTKKKSARRYKKEPSGNGNGWAYASGEKRVVPLEEFLRATEERLRSAAGTEREQLRAAMLMEVDRRLFEADGHVAALERAVGIISSELNKAAVGVRAALGGAASAVAMVRRYDGDGSAADEKRELERSRRSALDELEDRLEAADHSRRRGRRSEPGE